MKSLYIITPNDRALGLMETKQWDISQLPMLRPPTQDTQVYQFTCALYRQCPRSAIIILRC